MSKHIDNCHVLKGANYLYHNVNKEKAKALLKKYETGELGREEQLRLNQWYLSALAESKEALSTEQLEQSYVFLKAKLPLTSTGKTAKLWPRIVVAAAAVAAITLGVWLYTSTHPNAIQNSALIRYANDIDPGKNIAIITLANGRKITLSSAKTGVTFAKGRLQYTDGTKIADARSAETLLASTPIGGTYQFILPDGTKVWLNAASSVAFPSSLANDKRRVVEITGEAYFEVAQDKAHPFVVKTTRQELEVLGTHFNINAYDNEPAVETTLLEGSIEIYAINSYPDRKGPVRYRLKPNQHAVLNKEEMKITDVDPEASVAWKNGYLKFNQESIQSIMRKLSRWYNIDVAYESGLPQEKFTGRISRFKHISQVLKLMEAGKSVRFKVEGRRVTVIR